ncbi:MAG: metallophosphoesterase [Oscillospiraceae bacterium]|nr:metallophosphoesterase [Oscillospiraceae bacterium]
MIKFIVASDMRFSFSSENDMHISSLAAQKIESIVFEASSECRFIADLGDTVDGKASAEESRLVIQDTISLYDKAPVSLHFLMGERDRAVTNEVFLQLSGYAMRYRAFDVSDYRCIFLDTLCSENGFEIDEEQFQWLSRLLDKSHRPAIIFSHAPIAGTDESNSNEFVANREKLRSLFEKSHKVALVVSGHAEKSEHLVLNNVPYITLSPSYSSDEATFARFSVSSEGVTVDGFGAQESFTIEHPFTKNKEEPLLSRIKRFLFLP